MKLALDVSRSNTIGNSLTELYKFFEQNGNVSNNQEKAEHLKQSAALDQMNVHAVQAVPKESTPDKEFLVRQELARNFDIQSGLNVYNLV